MAVVIATTRAAIRTTTGTQDFTTTDLRGLTPKAALFFLSRSASDGVADDHAAFSFGMAISGATRWSARGYSQHGVTTTATGGANATGSAVLMLNPVGGATEVQADFSAWLTDGIRLNFTTVAATGYLLTVILFAGSDLSVAAGTVTMTAAQDVAQTVSGLGLTPELVVVGNASNNYRSSIGFVNFDTGTPQVCNMVCSRTGATTSNEWSAVYNNRGIVQGVNSGTAGVGVAFEYSNPQSGSFDITPRTAAGGSTGLMYLAFNFGGKAQRWVGIHTTPTTTGVNSDTQPGFRPQAILQLHSQAEVAGTIETDADAGSWSLAVATPTVSYDNSQSRQDGVTTTNTQSLSDDQLVNLPAHDGSTLFTGTLSKFTRTGWQTDYTAVAANAKLWPTLAIGSIEYILSSLTGTSTVDGVLKAKANARTTINGTSTVSGTLTAKGNISAASNGTSTVSGILKATGKLATAISGVATVTGILEELVVSSCSPRGSVINYALPFGRVLPCIDGNMTVNDRIQSAFFYRSQTETTPTGQAATIDGTSTVTGTLKASGRLTVAINGTSTVTPVLQGEGLIDTAIAGTSTVGALIKATGKLQAVLSGTSTVVAVARAAGYVDATINGTSTVVPDIKGTVNAFSVLAGTSTVSGDIIGKILTSATLAGTSSVTAVARATGKLQAVLAGTSSVVSDIAGKIKIFSALAGTSTVSGDLNASGNLRTALAGISSVQSDLAATGRLAAALAGTSLIDGHLGNAKTLRASSVGQATVTATIKAVAFLRSADGGTSTVTGDVVGKILISATVSGSATVVADALGKSRLQAVLAGTSTVVGVIKGRSHVQAQINGVASISATIFAKGLISANLQGTTVVIGVIIALGRLQATIGGTSSVSAIPVATGVPEFVVVGFRGMYRNQFKAMR